MSMSALEPLRLGDTAQCAGRWFHAVGGYRHNVIREPKITCRSAPPRWTGSTAAGDASKLDASWVWPAWWRR